MNTQKYKSELISLLDEITPLKTAPQLCDYNSFLMKEYFLGHGLTIPVKTFRYFLEKDSSSEISASTVITYAGTFRLFKELHYFNSDIAIKWVLLLKSIRDCTGPRFQKFPDICDIKDHPGSEIKLLKAFEWLSENPDNFPPLVLVATIVLRLIRMGWIDQSRDLYFFCSFALVNEGLSSFAYNRNLEVAFKSFLQCESGDEDKAIADFAKFLLQQLAVSREEFGEQILSDTASANSTTEPKFLFGKGIKESAPLEKLPDPQLLHEEAEFIAQESYNSFQKHCNNLTNVDQDLKYIAQQTSYDRKRLPGILKLIKEYTGNTEVIPAEIRWFHESQVRLIAPHGSYWRGKIPENQMIVLTIELRDQIMQLYLMELLWKYVDPKSILKKDIINREVLRRIYILDLKSEEANRDWISINREVFFHFLGRLEEETVKWNKRQEGAGKI